MLREIFVFIFGSVVGSFLNVCIHRLPLGESIIKPRSYCPRCKKSILWYDNIPFLSYIILRGRCRFCKARISFRYFIVELITAVLFLIFYNRYGFSYYFFLYIVLVSGLIIATSVDLQHRIIPDEISIGGIIIGLLFNVVRGIDLKPLSFNFQPIRDSLLGIILGGGIIYLTGFLFDLVYFRLLKKPPVDGETESMGGGDIKFLAMIGAFLGWKAAILTFFIAPILGAVVGIINLKITKKHTIPYGPFLALGALITIFWQYNIMNFIIYKWLP